METITAQNSTCVVSAKSIGYVPQQPWIQNKTLRGNITFEKIYHEDYYQKTIEACALLDDIKLLAAGDLTEIGEKVYIEHFVFCIDMIIICDDNNL